MKKLKIAVWHNLPSGGGKRALYYHVRGLVERGHIVESWCPPTVDQTYLPLSELIVEHIVPFSWQSRRPRGYYNLVNQIAAMKRHCQECAEQINHGGFDLLFANACMLFRNPPIGRYVNLPSCVYLGEPARWLYEAKPQLPWAALPPPKKFWWSPGYLRKFLKNLIVVQGLRVQVREELASAQAFDAILVNSMFSRESVLRAYGLDAKVCYLGVDTELFRQTGTAKENFVVGLGGLDPAKGVDRAIRALATIEANKRPDLIWIGNYSISEYAKEMETLASLLKVNLIPKVQVADEEVVDLLNRASLMIYTPRLEPFGFAPLEANACGTPVVAIAEGGVRESVKPGINGILIDDDDPHAIGAAILHLLEHSEIAREMSLRVRRYVLENWSWETAINRLEKHFFDLSRNKEYANAQH